MERIVAFLFNESNVAAHLHAQIIEQMLYWWLYPSLGR